MQKIPIRLSKPGMVLAKDVFRNNSPAGIPVCAKNSVLSETLITRLEQLDVRTVYVKGHPVWEDADASLEDLLKDLDHRFEKVRQDPLAEKLRMAYVDYLKGSMGDEVGRKKE